MRKTPDLQESFVEKAKQIYYQIKPMLEKKFSPEDYVTIDVDSGDYFVAESGLNAIRKAQRKYPNRKFFLAQVGRITEMLK